ncbi:MAG: hypothetical protein LUH82_00980 [Clostridiales bacterium]|nr:hypothetical protein [Clostridiales bacterium]
MEKKKVYAVATAHLDTVWRWNLAKTIEDFIPDTIQKNIDLIEKYPHYRFNFEGAYRYELIEEYYPKHFEIIKDLIARGRWNVAGSEYENGDVNIPSVEAIFRNILLGNNYFYEKFGKKSTDIFLPDCFGFSKALPAIINHAGLAGFSTQKLSWGAACNVPFDTGVWQGVDSSRIYASLQPGSYRHKFDGDIRADLSVISKISDSAFKYAFAQTMAYYGTGDQGGAPDESSVAALEESVSKNESTDFEVVSASTDEMFNELKKTRPALPIYDGELLMTSHGAGAYTSRAMAKRLNSQCESLADFTEKACAAAEELGVYDYPLERLQKSWKRIIKHQFHDDIAGTSIAEVYNESYNDYFVSQSELKYEYTAAAGAIANELDTGWVSECAVIVNNPASFDRQGAVSAHVKIKHNATFLKVVDKEGNEVKSQINKKSGKEFDIVFMADVKALGWRVYDVKAANSSCALKSDLAVTEHTLENSKYKIIFNKNGDIASITDKKLGKQLLDAPIKLALLQDNGSLAYPSWEIKKDDIDKEPVCYANTPEFEIAENGAARVALKITRQLDYSDVTQIVSLASGSEYIKVENFVDWRSRHSLLKAVFPFSCYNRTAAYDLGLGVIKRETNTSGLYEVPAQKWADITAGSGEYGVSVFSECKYGWDKPAGNTLRLSCIHTPAGAFTKDARQDLQDLGRNIFAFGIFSHSGEFENGTQAQNELFQKELTAFQTNANSAGSLADHFSFMQCDNSAVLIKAVKLAEKKDGIVVRICEANGKAHKNVRLNFYKEITSAENVLASEEFISKAKSGGKSIIFDLAPFEVKSFKVRLTPYEKKARESQTKIELSPNAKGFTFNEDMRNVILQGGGCSLPGEQIQPALTIGGVNFRLSNPRASQDVTVARGQRIQIPAGADKIYILASSTLSDEKVSFFADSKEIKLTIHSFKERIGQWDSAHEKQQAYVKDVNVGVEFTHTHHPEGDLINSKAYFYVYELAVKGKRILTLPENNRIIILAASAVNRFSNTCLATRLTDRAPDTEFEFNAVAPIDRIKDKTQRVMIRAGKIEDQRKNGKGKGIKRDNIVTNIIRSYTKSEW